MSFQSTHDARVVLVRDKYFSLRPKPLERWLWRQSIAPSAERVFWLHWEEGHRNKTWCSEIPLRRVAAECSLDVSTVTRAYQQLATLGLIRRQDPGRDPRNPFQQATALTEVRVPRELLCELERHPNRRSPRLPAGASPAATPAPQPTESAEMRPAATPRRSHRERMRELNALEDKMSAGELSQFREAMRTHAAHMQFDGDSRLGAEDRARALSWLEALSRQPPLPASTVAPVASRPAVPSGPRKLSVFELARIRREITRARPIAEGSDLLRQVIWAIEEGSLRKFDLPHAVNIALKKIREGLWSRPNRMPPNWMPTRGMDALAEQCRSA